jgi:hypothetical protein
MQPILKYEKRKQTLAISTRILDTFFNFSSSFINAGITEFVNRGLLVIKLSYTR